MRPSSASKDSRPGKASTFVCRIFKETTEGTDKDRLAFASYEKYGRLGTPASACIAIPLESLVAKIGVRRRTAHAAVSQGLITEASVSSKSLTLHVTRMRSWTIAVAAINPSISPRERIARGGPIRPRFCQLSARCGRHGCGAACAAIR